MNSYRNLTWLVMLLSVFFITGGVEAQDEKTDVNGHIVFDFPNAPEPIIEINFSKRLISIFAGASGEHEEVAELIEMLDGVYIRGYDSEAVNLGSMTHHYENKLRKEEWDLIAKVKEDNETYHIHVLFDSSEKVVLGLFIIYSEDDKTVFMNVFGRIDPTRIRKLVEHTAEVLDLD